MIRVRVDDPFKYFLYCGLGILGDRIRVACHGIIDANLLVQHWNSYPVVHV